MNLFSKFKKEKKTDETPRAPLPEVAVSESSVLYSGSDFTKYNPDQLVGRKGLDIYKRMAKDEQIKAGLKFKKDAITSRGFYFDTEAIEEELGDDEAQRRVEIFNKIISNIDGSFTDCLLKILSAMRDGFSISEKVEKFIDYQGRRYVGLKDIKRRPASSFRFQVDEFDNILYIEQTSGARNKKLDMKHFIHYVVSPEEDPHYGESELRSCHRAWWSKDNIIKLRNIYLEQHAGGFTEIKPPKNKKLSPGTKEYNDILSVFGNINLKTFVLLPNNEYEVKRHYPSGQGSEAFEKAIKQSDMSIAVALLIPSLLGVSPQGQHGGFSQAETQLSAFFWTLKNDSDRLSECLNEQLFKPLSMVNFGDDLFPKFSWASMSAEKAVETIRLFMDLVKNRVLTASEEDEEFIRTSLELPAVKEVTEGGKGGRPVNENPEKLPAKKEEEDSKERQVDEFKQHEEESVLGRGAVKVVSAAFKKATSRVSFALIGKESEDIVVDEVERLATVTDAMLRSLVTKMKKGGSLEDSVKNNFKGLKIDRDLKTALNTRVTAMLGRGVKMGTTQARKEIDSAKGSQFTKVDSKRLNFIADDYYRFSSFKITGDLSDSLQKIVETEILNGTRFNKSLEEVEQAIYLSAVKKGVVSELVAVQQLGAEVAGNFVPDSRLVTTVRTATFDAINTARDSYFSDPALGDFVRAYEYSAILDSRTTDICRHLDGDNAGDHSKEWYASNSSFRPPNHFNCRSLLVAVTVNDLPEYKEGPEPSVDPQEGFS